jgi:hypothetical protein
MWNVCSCHGYGRGLDWSGNSPQAGPQRGCCETVALRLSLWNVALMVPRTLQATLKCPERLPNRRVAMSRCVEGPWIGSFVSFWWFVFRPVLKKSENSFMRSVCLHVCCVCVSACLLCLCVYCVCVSACLLWLLCLCVYCVCVSIVSVCLLCLHVYCVYCICVSIVSACLLCLCVCMSIVSVCLLCLHVYCVYCICVSACLLCLCVYCVCVSACLLCLCVPWLQGLRHYTISRKVAGSRPEEVK